MKLQFRVPAYQHEIFEEHCFDKSVGKTVTTKDFGRAKITKAEVIENGKAALITINTLEDIKVRHGTYRGR